MTKLPGNISSVINSARALAESSGIATLQKAIESSNIRYLSQNQINVSSAKSLSRVVDATEQLNINPMKDLMSVSSAKAFSALMAQSKFSVYDQLHKSISLFQTDTIRKFTAQAEYLRLTEMQRLLGVSSAKALSEAVQPLHMVLARQIEKQLKLNDYGALYRAIEASNNNVADMVKQNKAGYGESTSQQADKPISNFESELLSNITLNNELVESIQELGKSAASNDVLYPEAVNDLVFGLPDVSKKNIHQTLLDYFIKLTPKAQGVFRFLIYTILVQLMIAVEVDILKEKVKPVIDEYVCKSPNASVKFVGKLILCTSVGDQERTRLIKATMLNVRATPNTKGKLLDTLLQFEPVVLISKSKDLSWSLIRYKNQDGESVEGWVLSRYLHKPKI